MKTPEVWSPIFSTYVQPKTMPLRKKTRCRRRRGAWNLRQNLAFVHISKGQGGREVGKGCYLLFPSKPITVWRCYAEHGQFWQEGWRIWVYLYDRSFHPVVLITRCRVLGALRLDGVAMCQKTEAVRLLDKDCLPRRRWWSHKVLGWLKGSLRGFFLLLHNKGIWPAGLYTKNHFVLVSFAPGLETRLQQQWNSEDCKQLLVNHHDCQVKLPMKSQRYSSFADETNMKRK